MSQLFGGPAIRKVLKTLEEHEVCPRRVELLLRQNRAFRREWLVVMEGVYVLLGVASRSPV